MRTADARRELWIARNPQFASRVAVRINDAGAAWFADDLGLLAKAHVQCAMLPKAEAAAQVDAVMAALPAGGSVLPLIETARGVQGVEAIAAATGVVRLAFGTLDYALDLGLSGDERGLLYAASRIAVASRCAGIAAPVAGVTAALDDEPRLLADLAFARALGFGAKLCIHPRQVAAIRAAFAPTAAEVDWARRVLAAWDQTPGAVELDGTMVDGPVLKKAQAIIDGIDAAAPPSSAT